MSAELFLPPTLIAAMFSFALASSITPGPNNIMLTASGVNFGIRRTLPHMAGITAGVLLVVAATGYGLGFFFAAFPLVRLAIKLGGIAYTLWLAWKVATAGTLGTGGRGTGGPDAPHPMTFPAAFLFQGVNPKLWFMAITAAALYVRPGHLAADVPLMTLVFFVINIPCMLLWVGFGAVLRDVLQVPRHIRFFNITMGFLLVLSVLALVGPN